MHVNKISGARAIPGGVKRRELGIPADQSTDVPRPDRRLAAESSTGHRRRRGLRSSESNEAARCRFRFDLTRVQEGAELFSLECRFVVVAGEDRRADEKAPCVLFERRV